MADRKDIYEEAIIEQADGFAARNRENQRPLTGCGFAEGVAVLAGTIAGGFVVLVYELRAIRSAIEAARGSGDFGGPG
jgi:hypothetical protein